MGRVWFSSHSIETKFSLDNWSVFLQDGVTLFGSVSNDLISIEGITSVGLFGVFFRAVLGMFSHPVVVRWALKSEEFPHSAVFASGADSVCIPLANESVGLGPSPAGPVASRPPLVGRSASAVTRCFFHQGVFHARAFRAWWLASHSSGSRSSREGVLACLQGASDSLRHPSPVGETVFCFRHSGTGVALGNVPSTWHGILPATGRGLSVFALKGCNSAPLAFLF